MADLRDPFMVDYGTHAVLRVCGWCSAAAQRLEMAMWSDVPEELVRWLRAAGLTSDALCPNCDRRQRQRLGLRLPRFGVIERAEHDLPDLGAA